MSKEESIAAILGLVGGTFGTTLLTLLFNRRKTSAEAENINAQITLSINKAALDQIESLRIEVERLTKEQERLRKSNAELQERVNELLAKLGKYQRKDSV